MLINEDLKDEYGIINRIAAEPDPSRIERSVLNQLARYYIFPHDREGLEKIAEKIALRSQLSIFEVKTFLTKRIPKILQISEFLIKARILWRCPIHRAYKNARIYLRKIYRTVPVFDIPRAEINLNTLIQLYRRLGFFPRLTTILGLTVYITDKRDPYKRSRIKHMNLIKMTGSSGYAFHRNKHKILNLGIEI